MKRKLIIVLLLMMISMNLSAGIFGKLAGMAGKKAAVYGVHKSLHSCTGGDMTACFNLGVTYLYGNEKIEKDEEEAKKYFRMSCDGKLGEGCAALATLTDSYEGLELLKLGCDYGEKEYSCEDAAELCDAIGEADNALKYYLKVADNKKLDCKSKDKNILTCKKIQEFKVQKANEIAELRQAAIAKAYAISEAQQVKIKTENTIPEEEQIEIKEEDTIVELDDIEKIVKEVDLKTKKNSKAYDEVALYMNKAKKLLLHECNNEENPYSCLLLSENYRLAWYGYDVKNADPLAEKFDKKSNIMALKSCKNGNADVCLKWAKKCSYEEMKDRRSNEEIAIALKFATKAQELGKGQGLEILADIYMNGSGSVKQNKKKGKVFYLKALKMLKVQCEKGDGAACYNLSTYYESGFQIRKNIKQSKLLEEKGLNNGYCDFFFLDKVRKGKCKEITKEKCNNNDAHACESVDRDKARKLYKKRCDDNDGKSCDNYARMLREDSRD